MADFSPKKGKETATAKGSLPTDNAEHQEPPRLYLEHHHLEKLGLKKMPAVGSKIKISGLAHVGSTSENQDRGDGGKARRSMTLHMHKMEVGKDGPGAEEDQAEQTKQGAKAEMDKALGSEAAKGKKEGKTPTPRGGGD